MTDSIPQVVLQNLGQITEETGKEIAKESVKITESMISGKELLGGIATMTDEELAKAKAEDQKKVEAEMKTPARNVEQEIKLVVDEKLQAEDQKEKQFLENLRLQREAEEQERQQMTLQMGISTNPAKQKKSRGSAFAGKKKSQQPDPASMSQTSEFKGKID